MGYLICMVVGHKKDTLKCEADGREYYICKRCGHKVYTGRYQA